MKRLKNTPLGLGLLAILLPVAAFANLSAGDQIGTNVDEIRAQLEAQGYTVLETEVEDGVIEVEYEIDGQIYEAEIAEISGLVTEVELEEDDD